jgi:hypothetical protein
MLQGNSPPLSERPFWYNTPEKNIMSPCVLTMNHVVLLKRLLLFFWAVWLSVVFLSNLADAAKGLDLLGESWTFASGNGKLIQETTSRYRIPVAVSAVLFTAVIFWEGIAAVLFWRAGWSFQGRNASGKPVYLAFTISLLLWGAFLVADEVFIAYRLGSTHLLLFVAHLATLLAIDLLPEAYGWSELRPPG